MDFGICSKKGFRMRPFPFVTVICYLYLTLKHCRGAGPYSLDGSSPDFDSW